MKRAIATRLQQLTFQRQLGITVALGILSLALLSSLASSWQSKERVSRETIEHGRHIAENLARQSALALVLDSPENANEAANNTLAFHEVVGLSLFHTDGRLLLTRGDDSPPAMLPVDNGKGLDAAKLTAENADVWSFSAPVYSRPFAETPLGEAAVPELLGWAVVVISKTTARKLTSDIFLTNLYTSLFFAMLFLLLIRFLSRNMTRPLNELSESMTRAQMGELHVRAKPGGPRDIAAMAYAFNDMMKVQNEREEVMQKSEEKYRTLVESALSIILRWDTLGHIVYINPYAESLFGYRSDELIGQHIVGSIVPESESTSRDLSQLMADILAHPEKYQLNINENIKKNGERRWIMWTNRPIFDDSGKMIEILSVGNDITERKQAEDALNASMHLLEEKELAKSRFLAAASHDLRQPLAAANLFIDTLKLTATSPQQSSIIQKLDLAMSTFNGLLDSLLHVSKLDSGVIKPEYSSIDVGKIFNWLEQNFSAICAEKQIELRLFLPTKDKLFIHSDIGLVNSVLLNLVSNAIKFSSNSTILVSARRRNGMALFQVWDAGIGIPKENIAKIFDEFYQVGNHQRDRSKGLGLGLSIVKRALALLSSSISCRSKIGRGSVFEFTLPLEHSPNRATQRTVQAAPQEALSDQLFAKNRRFVVVDDDMLIAQAMVFLLRGMGGEVTSFHSAEEALHHNSIAQADYFIVDYMLGGSFNGIQFLQQVRKKLGKPINAVLMTGDTSSEFIRAAENCEWPALHKPVSIHKLKSVLSKSAPRTELPP